MREFGYVCVQVWFDPSEAEIVRNAATICSREHDEFGRSRMKLATWVRRTAVAAAHQVTEGR